MCELVISIYICIFIYINILFCIYKSKCMNIFKCVYRTNYERPKISKGRSLAFSKMRRRMKRGGGGRGEEGGEETEEVEEEEGAKGGE